MSPLCTSVVSRRACRVIDSTAALLLPAALASCTLVPAPVDEQPEPPKPGFVVSRPFDDIRTLHDVVVLGVDVDHVTRALAVGADGAAIAWDGERWTREDTGVDVDLFSISGGSNDDGVEVVLAVGQGGTILSRDADGWTRVPSPVADDLFSVWVRTVDDAFIVGDHGTVLRFDGERVVQLVDEVLIDSGAVDDNGDAIAFPIADPLKGVMGRGDDDVFAVGPRGVVYHFDGERFTLEPTQTNRPLVDVFTRAGVWAATTDGVLLRRHDGEWSDNEFVAPAPVFLQGIWARGDDDVFAVGLAAQVFHRDSEGWTIVDLDDGTELRAIDGATLAVPDDAEEGFVPGREIFAVGAGGRVVRGPAVLPADGETTLPSRPYVAEEN
jgi:hypothetical protein